MTLFGVLLFLNNDPQLEEDGEALFGGEARTYYGRWTYKFEQAERLGAAGAVVIHTLESASYQFSVIGNTGSRQIWQRTYKLDLLSWLDEEMRFNKLLGALMIVTANIIGILSRFYSRRNKLATKAENL